MEKWVPGAIIGGGALVAIYFLSKGGRSSPIVSNALVPSAFPSSVPSRDPARVAAFGDLANVALGAQRLAEQGASISSQLELGRFRLQEQSMLTNAALNAQDASGARSLEAIKSGQATQLEMSRINANATENALRAWQTDRNYDRELQARALDQTFALAQGGQIGQGISSLLGGILAALRPVAQQAGARPPSSSPAPASGSSGGGITARPSTRVRYPSIPTPGVSYRTPPFVPGYPSPSTGDPFMWGAQAPQSPTVPYYPSDYFANIPLDPWGGYEMPPLPPLPSSDLPSVGFTDNWWDWPTTGPGEGAGGIGDYYGDYLPTDDWVW